MGCQSLPTSGPFPYQPIASTQKVLLGIFITFNIYVAPQNWFPFYEQVSVDLSRLRVGLIYQGC